MAKKRYKIRKEQLERVVESFVMEQAAPDARKHVKGSETKAERTTVNPPEKDLEETKSQSPDAKKHVKDKMDGKMVEKSPNLKEPKKMSMNDKMKQASEAKKHQMAENTELSEEELNEFFGGKKKRKQELENDFKLKSKIWSSKGKIDRPTRTEFLEFMRAAEEDNYEGKVGLEGRKIVYRKAEDINWAGLGLSQGSGGMFGGG